MERELVITGIGGQGIQLAAQVLARAAVGAGREVQLFGSYGGMMRGGNTEATLVFADGPIEAPPTVGRAWSGMLLHHDYSEPTLRRLKAGSVVLVNSTVFEQPLDRSMLTVFDVPATAIALDVGTAMVASMVMVGAYVALTGLVPLDAVKLAVAEALPSYRARHVAINEDALDAGYVAVPPMAAPAWEAATV